MGVSLLYLLFAIGSIALPQSFFGQGSMDILWLDVSCKGDENYLSECGHSESTLLCFHTQDASVLCPSEF